MYDIIDLYLIIASSRIKFYDYRQARVQVPLVNFDTQDPRIQDIKEYLFRKAKASPDNHVLFEVSFRDNSITIQFSDGKMILGLGVIKGSW